MQRNVIKNLVKLVCLLFCGLVIGIAFRYYSESRTISLHYLDSEGSTHTLILPIKDKKKLFSLMQKLFAEDSFAYTILGTKPVSWVTYQNLSFAPLFNSSSEYRILSEGWKTWEKYQHLFPSAHLWAESLECYPNLISILIVNKKQFNVVVNNHKKDFENVLQREIIDGFQLLKEAKNCSLMHDVLKEHQALLGIVLGYGRDNAWKFNEGCKNRMPIGCIWSDEEWSSMEASIESNLNVTDYYLSVYSCPSFAGDPNTKESLALKAEYISTKQKVINYYKGKDFLEATLSLLAGHDPINN